MSSPVAVVKCGTTAINIVRLGDGRYRYGVKKSNKWVQVTSGDLAKLKRKAFEDARIIDGGRVELSSMTQEQKDVCSWVIKRGLTVDTLQQLLKGDAGAGAMMVSDLVSEFKTVKERGQGRSSRHVSGLKNDLDDFAIFFPGRTIGSIMARDIERWLHSKNVGPRRKNNLRQNVVAAFRWARDRGYLPDVKTQAERTERAKIRSAGVTTYTRQQLVKLAESVRDIYRPWLFLASWAGIRNEEMFPPSISDKSPLMWDDILFDRKIIIVRPETSKTGKRRIIPMTDALIHELQKIRGTGRVGPLTNVASRETARLGKELGLRKWDQNALRHSFGSYRAAVTQNIGQVSLEMGNSISMCQSAYHEAKTHDEGVEWFSAIGREDRAHH